MEVRVLNDVPWLKMILAHISAKPFSGWMVAAAPSASYTFAQTTLLRPIS
jgi:hypothetical protein